MAIVWLLNILQDHVFSSKNKSWFIYRLGKVYVLDTPNGVLVKEIHESNREGYVSCYSINPDPKFKPFDVLMDEVFGMYRVLMCLSAK